MHEYHAEPESHISSFCSLFLDMEKSRRTDALTAQKIDVALIFKTMLDTGMAAKYLRDNDIPLHIALRVLIYRCRQSPSPPKMIGDQHAENILSRNLAIYHTD